MKRLHVLLCAVILCACGDDAPDPGDDRLLSVRMPDRQRTFILYIPSRHDEKAGSPLIIAYHGSPGNGPGMRISTGLDEIADSEGWLIAYPNGVGGNWGAGCLCSDADFLGVDDVDFTTKLIERVRSEFEVDTSRIYSVGFSAGGLMSYRVACDLSRTFAAAAAVASSMTWAQTETCEPEAHIPVFTMIGTNDSAFPWAGSGPVGGDTMPVDSTFSFWGEQNGCGTVVESDYSAPAEENSKVRRDRYRGCPDTRSEVSRYVIEGGEHAWPGTAIDALKAFFDRHRLQQD